MKAKHLLLPLLALLVSYLLIAAPFQRLLPGYDDVTQQLFRRFCHASLIIILAFAVIRYYRLSLLAGFPLLKARQWYALLPVAVLLLIYLLLTAGSFRNARGSVTFFSILVGVVFLKAFAEEIIFRGLITGWFLKNGVSTRKSILWASLFFAAVHILNYPVHQDWVTLVNQVLFSFFMGLLFGSITRITGNLLIPGLIHTIVNLPSALKRFATPEQVIPAETAVSPGLADDLLSIFFYQLIYSPMIILALWYFKQRKWFQDR